MVTDNISKRVNIQGVRRVVLLLSPDELEKVEEVVRENGFRSRSDALRHLIRQKTKTATETGCNPL